MADLIWMSFGVVSEIVEGKWAVLGVNVGHPIVTSGTLWRSYSLPLGVATRLFPNYFGISRCWFVAGLVMLMTSVGR